ncbi:B12-binding domain-containing protein [Actinomadura sp. 21ATH]|uniref:cobalamin B12-binding domain-containing protein n=1 Tax=Actinomadura sp. 21ATH TaxID=1735444 RepID=UPI0035BED77B
MNEPPTARPLAERFWDMVTTGRERSAVAAAAEALEAGTAPEDLLLGVIGAVQDRIGREWAADRITVVQEHVATAVSERVIAALAHHPAWPVPADAPADRRVTVACAEGEWHALPARLVAEVLRLNGWEVDYLGAHVPARYLAVHLRRTRPDALALSASLAGRLPAAHRAIAAAADLGVPVLAGGPAFGPGGRYALLLDAGGWAPDARAAAAWLEKGAGGGRAPERGVRTPPPAVEEYALLARTAGRLERDAYAAMAARFPDRTEQDFEWIDFLIESLAAALYVDDPDLFTGCAGWAAGVLAARGAAAEVPLAALEVLGGALTDFPRASALIAEARLSLSLGPPAP